MSEHLLNWLLASWGVVVEMAPYLLFGFLVAGVLSVCIPREWVERYLGRPGLGPVFTASLVGVPLPLCSCSVIPVSASIRRHGASRAATTAFLISTPQTGVDSIAVTYALLGPVFAVFRPAAALVTGVLGGVLVQLFGEKDPDVAAQPDAPRECKEACCCGHEEHGLVYRALRYGLVALPRDVGPALLLGVAIAGALTALVPQNELYAYVGGGVLSIVVMMAAGVPIYVCATASVPLAAGFIHLGASPGAALAFLIAGPATNAATLVTVWKVLGRRTTIVYGLTIAASAIVGGLLLDGLVRWWNAAIPHSAEHVHATSGAGWLAHAMAILLLVVLGVSLFSSDSHAD
ncbi:MAG: SO_0444 family Cu/Zn efflux transporter [Pirellulales bacterium]|nr:SO_0444 family Cu/Zn efflux transporter [Pirellulales bacterium]